ncbi:MAG: T9SS type A sorting domain-containing protein [Bacteroidetes bacterium]|nr:T9SS type A sorting domain-containing protein [Bacteroidota bacterium]
MKIKLLTLVLIIYGYSYSQNYIPMLEEDHTWSVDVYFDPFKCDCPHTVTQQVTVSGSIVVDGKTYKRVFNNSGGTSCLVREENGIVYKYSEISNNEVILYDFTLEIGNIFTLPVFPDDDYCSWEGFNNIAFQIEVVNVSTQFIANEDRKVIEFDFINEIGITETWIEGLGSVLGFDPIGQTLDITIGTALVCFTKNGTTYFFNNATSCDNTTLSIDDLDRDQIILYPNPVTSTSILQFSSLGIIDMIKIYNVSGKLVKEEKVNKDYVLIDAMQYRSGLYFYQVFSGNKLLKTEKFIIK